MNAVRPSDHNEEYALPVVIESNVAQLKDAPGKEKRIALIIGFLFFGLFMGWAAFTPLDAGAVATGTIVVSGSKKAVQHREGGIVSGIEVSEGELVKRGQTLLTINATQILAVERAVSSEMYSLLAERERLISERDGRPNVPTPVEFASIPEADLPMAEAAMRGQLRLFQARRSSVSSRQGVLGQREKQNVQQIAGLERQFVSNREQSRLIGEELTALRELEKRGFASKSRVREVERAAASLEGNGGQITAQIAQVQESTGETALQSITLERQIVEEASTRLRDVSVRLDDLIPRLAATREELERTKVKAPVDGKVVGLSVFTVGGVVAPGEVLMQIVPQDRELLIKAIVSPSDADDISPGMSAQIRFFALQERNLPILKGEVVKISADSFTDERTGDSFFESQIRVPESQMAIIESVRGGVSPLRPGLPAEIVFPVRKRTVLQYLIEPLTQTLWLAGREQ